MIVIIVSSPPCGLNMIQEVGNERQSTFPGLVRQSQKLDAVVDRKLSNDWDLTSISIKEIGDKISEGSSWDLYMHSRIKFASDFVQTHILQFLDMGFLTINALDEVSELITPCYQNPKVYRRWPLEQA